MKRNSAILWTVFSTLLCGWPGACVVAIGIPTLFTQSETPGLDALYLLVGTLSLAIAIRMAYTTFKSSQGSGITGLTLMAALTGVLLCGTAAFLFIGIGAATTTTGMAENVLAVFAASVLMLIGAGVLWFKRSRAVPAAEPVVVEAPKAPIPPE
jgi:hypothetical protein